VKALVCAGTVPVFLHGEAVTCSRARGRHLPVCLLLQQTQVVDQHGDVHEAPSQKKKHFISLSVRHMVSGSRDRRVQAHLLREMKAEYSVLWVEPVGVTLLGVSSMKIM